MYDPALTLALVLNHFAPRRPRRSDDDFYRHAGWGAGPAYCWGEGRKRG